MKAIAVELNDCTLPLNVQSNLRFLQSLRYSPELLTIPGNISLTFLSEKETMFPFLSHVSNVSGNIKEKE